MHRRTSSLPRRPDSPLANRFMQIVRNIEHQLHKNPQPFGFQVTFPNRHNFRWNAKLSAQLRGQAEL